VVGTVVAGRTRIEVEPLIGLFINSLVLRTDLSGDPSFRELLRRVREVTLGAYAHQDVPFEKLVEELQPERAAGRAPLFQVAFGLQNAPDENLSLPNLTLSALDFENEIVRFDLTVWFSEAGNKLLGNWTYSRDLFEAGTIELLQRHYAQLLQSIAENPEAALSTFEMLGQDEKHQRVLKRKERESSNARKLKMMKRRATFGSGLNG
jgi:non-ribosomal peptide synthetase component F